MTASPIRARRGLKARHEGRRAEVFCALWLMAKGYRILGFRVRTTQGEIDLLASKGGVLAVVEVKRRASLNEALAALTPRQRERLTRAARSIAARRPDLAGAAIRLDLLALAPGRWPRHIHDAWRGA
jgi:putative endonuclease